MEIIAIILGPILAVLITRWLDIQRAIYERKIWIFRTLMATRANKLSVDHVAALNLIQVDFSEHKEVIDAWNKYMENLHSATDTPEQKQKTFSEHDKCFARLLSKISKALKIKGIEDLDIASIGYSPRGWLQTQQEQELLRMQFQDWLQGNRSLKIKIEE